MSNSRPPIWSVGGYEPCGNVGVVADLKIFDTLGFTGAAAMTALAVVHHSGGGLQAISPGTLKWQLQRMAIDGLPAFIKASILPTPDLVDALCEWITEQDDPPAVLVDPVLLSEDGMELATPEAFVRTREKLLPLATVVTPSPTEVELLSHGSKASLATLLGSDGFCVLLEQSGTDSPRATIQTVEKQQTISLEEIRRYSDVARCQFSAALVANLATGLGSLDAVQESWNFVVRTQVELHDA